MPAALLIWIAYLLIPVGGWGLFEGRPLGLLSTTTMAAVCWLAHARGSLGRPRVLAVALGLKIALGMSLLLPHGFAARYYANDTFDGPEERDGEPEADRSVTRSDHRLRFGIDDEPDVPLAFFNERRFNYYRETEPDRRALPFSVTWQGIWNVPAGGAHQVYLRSPAGSTDVIIGDALSVHVGPTGFERWNATVNLPAGEHRISIAWSVPQGGARQFEAGWLNEGREEPFDDRVITRLRAEPLARTADRAVRAASVVIDTILLGWVLLRVAVVLREIVRRGRGGVETRDAIALVWMVGIADALLFAIPRFDRMLTLTGGDDWLTYESQARDILLNGPLMTEGAAIGQGQPFYTQPLYPYFLAACHWVFGSGFFGVDFVQRLFLTVTIVALWRILARLFDERAGAVGLVVALVVALEKFSSWAGYQLTEVLFVPLVSVWVYLLVRVASGDTARPRTEAAVAGIVGGLATLTRSSLLLGWIVVLPALALALRGQRRRLTRMAILMATMMAVVATASVRNWIVADRFVLIASEGPTVLFLGNAPPALPIPAAHKAQYERLQLDPLVQAVAEYARQQPRAFLRGLAVKARFALGLSNGTQSPGSSTFSIFSIATWMLAVVGLALLPRMGPAQPMSLVLTPFLLAATHLAVVVLFQPHVYADRLVMPFYVLLVPGAAIPFIALARGALADRREVLAGVAGTVLVLVAIVSSIGGFHAFDFDVFAAATLLVAVCLAGLPTPGIIQLAGCAVYATALVAWLVRLPQLHAAPDVRAQLLFLATALVAPTFFAGRAPGRTRQTGVAQVLAFGGGAALTIAGLWALGISRNEDRILLRGQVAAFGLAGAAAYALLWMESSWPAGGSLVTRAMQGFVFGLFAAILLGAELGAATTPVLVLAGMAIGGIHADRAGKAGRAG